MLTVPDFPKGDWVLLALGEVSRSRANPLIDSVVLKLARVDLDNPDSAPTVCLSKDVPVSQLPELKVGTIWRNGTPVAAVLGRHGLAHIEVLERPRYRVLSNLFRGLIHKNR
jgi:hypothetical protein